jgi:lysophospholipase L1-like esterase
MRDIERTVAKPSGTRRAIFIGDSFVESWFTPLSLPAAVQQRLPSGANRIEAINLGVAATDPRSYYYRIRDVALELQPDAVLLFIYAGNDFMAPDQGYSVWPRWIDESPGGSLVGSIMPRTNWLLVNRLDLAAFFRSRSTAPANDEAMLYAAVTAPREERLKRIVSYVKTYHYPNVPEEQLSEILSRGDNRFFDIAAPRQQGEQEYLLDWMFGTLMSWEARDFEVAKNREDAARIADKRQVEATFSWIEATDRLLRKRDVPFVVFLVPVGSVDPDYADFWKPWPRTYSWNYICDEWHSQLAARLAKTGIRYVDLREDLANVSGTYRKLDGHWSQKGEAIVADRIKAELEAFRSGSPLTKAQ